MEKLGITRRTARRASAMIIPSRRLCSELQIPPGLAKQGFFATKKRCSALGKIFASWINGEHLHSANSLRHPGARQLAMTRTRQPEHLYAMHVRKTDAGRLKTRNWQPAGPSGFQKPKLASAEIRDAA